jgi:hypothetical protein
MPSTTGRTRSSSLLSRLRVATSTAAVAAPVTAVPLYFQRDSGHLGTQPGSHDDDRRLPGELLNWSDDAEAVLATSGHHDASDANDCGEKMPCTSNVRSGERDLSHALALDEAKVPVDLGERCKQSAVPRCCCDSSVHRHQNRSEVR